MKGRFLLALGNAKYKHNRLGQLTLSRTIRCFISSLNNEDKLKYVFLLFQAFLWLS